MAKEIRSVPGSILLCILLKYEPTVPGDLIYLNAAGQPIIVLNSQKVAADLLDRRAAIYSDRPSNIVACEIMCGGLLLPFARYSDV
jgi:hypothetical protein